MSRPKSAARPRYPGGKLKPETASPAVVRAIIDAAKRGAANPLLRSEIGRLRLKDVLTDRQVMAATRFAALAGSYDRLKGMPRRTVASPSYQAGYGGGGEATREDVEIIEALGAGANIVELSRHSDRLRAVVRATKRYESARGVLRGVGIDAERSVCAVALYDEVVVSGRWASLCAGLDALASHFSA
ncbi:hypothetical protein [Hyphomicrobium sp.]|uniref:hypothetical protein n=1 Tax=Hyphomicrobium sp. TaxID=82 RepID=UPI0025B8E060|nr:hypothetical protein [Hyphomicrobium sp.]MCC7253823.1 hypothetical protein [Hyphomicrobium sp.]